MIVLDTSVLVEALGAGGSIRGALREALEQRERMIVPTLVLYEWLRGPRHASELALQEALFPCDDAVPFGAPEARVAAGLYTRVRRPRGREMDLGIAAFALVWNASLWTLNQEDFADIEGLKLVG